MPTMLLSAGAADTSGLITEGIKTAFTTAVNSIQGDVTTMLTLALPAGLAIFAIGFAIRKGVSFFQSLAA